MAGHSDFLMALGRIDGGSLIESADELIADAVSQVNRYGGTATLTLKITLKPNGTPGGGALKLTGSAKATMPNRPQGESYYWAGENGELLRNPPKDLDIFDGPRAVDTHSKF